MPNSRGFEQASWRLGESKRMSHQLLLPTIAAHSSMLLAIEHIFESNAAF